MRDSSKENISFGSAYGKRFAGSSGERIFEQTNRAFDKNAVAIEIIPMICSSGNAGVKPKIFVGVSIDASAVGLVCTGSITGTGGVFSDKLGFVTNEFEAFGTVLPFTNALKNELGMKAVSLLQEKYSILSR